MKDDLSIKDVKDNLFEKGHGKSSSRKEDGAFSASDLLEKLKEISIDSYIDESADAKVLEDVVADYVIESSDKAPKISVHSANESEVLKLLQNVAGKSK